MTPEGGLKSREAYFTEGFRMSTRRHLWDMEREKLQMHCMQLQADRFLVSVHVLLRAVWQAKCASHAVWEAHFCGKNM